MKIFFCGQRSFGAAVLEELVKRGHEIVGVSPAPRGAKKDRVELVAIRKKLPVISDGERLSYTDIPDGTEIIIAAHAHWIISDRALQKAKFGGIGFHPSLLPVHRGRDAVRWAVHNGDKITGGTVYWLDSKTDGGPVFSQELVFIKPGEDYHELWERIFPVGVKMIADAVDRIAAGDLTATEQDEECATWEPSFDRPRLRRNDLFRLSSGGRSTERCGTCAAYADDIDGYRCVCSVRSEPGHKVYVDDSFWCDSYRKA